MMISMRGELPWRVPASGALVLVAPAKIEGGSGAPLVLLHGFLATHRSFDDVIDALSRHLRSLRTEARAMRRIVARSRPQYNRRFLQMASHGQVMLAMFSENFPSLPDGTVLLFTQVPAQKFGYPRLATLNMDSTPPEIVNVKMNLLSINNVDYSSNGVWLAFEYNGERGTDIYYSTATGAGSTAIAADPADDFDPAWRPIQP